MDAFAKEQVIEEEGEEVGVADLLAEGGVEIGAVQDRVDGGFVTEGFSYQGSNKTLRGWDGGREGGE